MIVILLFLLAVSGLSQTTITGDGYRAVIRDHRIASLEIGGRNILTRPVGVLVTVEGTGQAILAGDSSGGVSVDVRYAGGRDLGILVNLRSGSRQRVAVRAALDLAGIPQDSKPFLPSAYAHPPLHPPVQRVFGYRVTGVPIVFPAASFNSRSAGLTVYHALDQPSPGFEVNLLAAGGPVVSTPIRLDPGADRQVEFRIAFHPPDWRAGLRAIRSRYPEPFNVHDPRAVEINGPFLWSPLASAEQVQTWRAQGVRWIEVIFTAPFIGEFAASREPWTATMDDQWHWEKMVPFAPGPQAPFEQIRAFMERQIPPWLTFSRLRSFIRTLHANGIRAFIYFQPSTAWEPYGVQKFPEDVARDRDGNVIPDWIEQAGMNPRPGSRWAAHIERQFEALLNALPEVDGVFMDQSHFDYLDYAHDDGVTLAGDRPVYRMGYAIRDITRKLVHQARARGKMVWWNGPWMTELGAPGDGHLSEASESIEAMKYFGLGNRPITTGATSVDSYDRVLLAGAQPAAPILSTIMLSHRYSKEVPAGAAPPAEEMALYKRYAPLFEQTRRREWVLEPGVAVAPEGFEANVFLKPDGDYAVPLVASHADGAGGWQFDVPVTLRLPGIRSASLLSADCTGTMRLEIMRAGGQLRLTIPRHRRASLIVLRRKPAPGRDSWNCNPAPIEIGWIGNPLLYSGEAGAATVFVANHQSLRQSVRLSAATKGVVLAGLPSTVELNPGERKLLPVRLTGTFPGLAAVQLSGAGQTVHWNIPVAKTRFAAGRKVLSARIEFEGWIPDGSPDLRKASTGDQFHIEGAARPEAPPVMPRKVTVGGVLSGYVPSLNSPRWRNLGPRLGDTRIPMQVKLPESVMLNLSETVDLAFHPAHARDEFRLRNVQLRLRFSDGSVLTSNTGREFTTKPAGAQTAQTIQVPLRFEPER